MNPQEMLRIVDAIARDRNVDKEMLFTDIEQAMVSAARKHFNAEDTEEFSATLDRISGKIMIHRDGEDIPMESLGRIPAQTAKQVMIQRFREDERSSIYKEFSDRVGEIVTGTAQRYEGGALVISIGRAEGFMPRSEQIPGEQHLPGERVRCLILDCRDEGHQVKIVLSRGNPEFIRRLFEVEVPEVSERIIEIKGIAREPGHRTKIAVASIDSKVDAVGACVGVRGSRIKNIVDELGGEKIDVVRWNESSQVLIANALRPAEIVEISLCFELGRATVVVNEDQLSLAIGKRGQNVRLAAKLTGWDVDILTPAEFAKGLDILDETLQPIEGMTEEMVDRLAALGFITVLDISDVGVSVLMDHLGDFGMTEDLAGSIVEICAHKAKIVAEQVKQDRAEAEKRKAEGAGTPGEAQADAILGGGLGGGKSGGGAGGAAAGGAVLGDGGGDIMDLLANRPAAGASVEGAAGEGEGEAAEESAEGGGDEIVAGEGGESEESDGEADGEVHDVAVAAEAAGEGASEDKSPAEVEIEAGPDETEVAQLARGEDGEDEDTKS